MKKATEIHNRANALSVTLLEHTNHQTKLSDFARFDSLVGLYNKVATGRIKIKRKGTIGVFEAGIIKECLKQALWVSALTGRRQNWEVVKLQELDNMLDKAEKHLKLLDSVDDTARIAHNALVRQNIKQ